MALSSSGGFLGSCPSAMLSSATDFVFVDMPSNSASSISGFIVDKSSYLSPSDLAVLLNVSDLVVSIFSISDFAVSGITVSTSPMSGTSGLKMSPPARGYLHVDDVMAAGVSSADVIIIINHQHHHRDCKIFYIHTYME